MNMPKPANSLRLAAYGKQRKGAILSFKDLVVWQRGMELAEEVYILTKSLPASEQYGLVSQMRRSAISVPSNIAEGKRRGSRKDFVQFLRIADGSASELETQLLLAKKIFNLRNTASTGRLLLETQRMLGAMLKKLSLPTASRKLPTSNSYA